MPRVTEVELADALEWLPRQRSESARCVVYDPPYAVGTPVRGREDGAAGSVFGPFGFIHKTLTEVCRVLRPGGVAFLFADTSSPGCVPRAT